MADLTIKRGDTWPPVDATLSDQAGAINLTTATSVTILFKNKTGSVAFSGACTIVSAAAGTVRYTWITSNTSTVNTYDVEFEILWSDSTKTTVPNEGYKEIAVVQDLG